MKTENWKSTRLILQDDKMGFSFNITMMYAQTETKMWYKDHLESSRQIEDIKTGEIHNLTPGTIYILDKNDRHVISPTTDITMACVLSAELN